MIEIFTEIEQGSPEWFQIRGGMPTMSCADKIQAEGRTKGSESKTRTGYLYQLADERIYGDVVEDYTNPSMERGKAWEDEARDIYALTKGVLPERVGFVKNSALRAGCSPDSLIGKKGILEIKTSFPRLWAPHLIKGTYPLEHKPQIQGGLWVSAREFCDLVIYWPKRQPYIIRIERDEAYIAELAKAVAAFNTELDAIVAAMRTRLNLREALEASA
jgi:YqaJ-like viral recombinase domain